MSRIQFPKRSSADFNVQASAKDYFFDRARVINSIKQVNYKRLWKAGAYIRTRARSIMRRRKRSSRPGQTPTVWSRDSFATLRNILYFVSNDWESVIVGPRGVDSLRLKKSNRQTVPELMERGGTSYVFESRVRNRWVPGELSFAEEVRERKATFQPRPFMGPALSAEIAAGSILGLWRS